MELPKERRLRVLSGITKVAEVHSYQAKSLPGIEAYFVSHGQSDLRQLFARSGWQKWGPTSREHVELGRL